MKQKIKSSLRNVLVAGVLALGLSASPIKAEEPQKISNPQAIVTRVQNEEAENINRLEICGKLPYNLDYYGILQEQGEIDYRKLSLSYVPLMKRGFGLGVTAQHKNSNVFHEQNDLGIVGRIQGKPTKNSFGNLDLKYFPKRDNFEWYGFVTGNKKVFFDMVGSYNHETRNTYMQPGIDYNLTKNFSLGLEGKFTGTNTDLKRDYLGIRAKIKF